MVGMLVSAWVQDPASARAPDNPLSQHWRDVTYQVPGSAWQPVKDTDPKLASRRVILDRREALHDTELVLTSFEAPIALAPSEAASRYFDERKQRAAPGGVLSDVKIGPHPVGGAAYPSLSVRFTPTAGPPITDQVEVLVFPADYDQRQRYLVVQWSDAHSGTTGAKPFDELDGFLASLTVAPLGTVLLTDDFSDQLNGPLSDNGTSEHYDVSYQEGEFAIQKSAPDFDGVYSAYIPGTFVDTDLTVDTHMTEAGYGPLAFLWCRRSADGAYRATVDPSDGSAHLVRLTAELDTQELVPWTRSRAINTGTASNHLELICRGSLIELDANGTPVLAVHNTDLSEGSLSIGAGGFTDYDVAPQIRFANLVVSQR